MREVPPGGQLGRWTSQVSAKRGTSPCSASIPAKLPAIWNQSSSPAGSERGPPGAWVEGSLIRGPAIPDADEPQRPGAPHRHDAVYVDCLARVEACDSPLTTSHRHGTLCNHLDRSCVRLGSC